MAEGDVTMPSRFVRSRGALSMKQKGTFDRSLLGDSKPLGESERI
jgi:hypothetical protein